MRRIPLPWTTVFTTGNGAGNEKILPLTPWLTSRDIAKIRITLEVAGLMGNLEVLRGYQVADVENNPIATVLFGSAVTANGVSYPTGVQDCSADTNAHQLFRAVVGVRNNSGTVLNLARIAGVLETDKQ